MPARTLGRIAVAGAVWLAAGRALAEGPCEGDLRRFCDGRPPLEQLSCLQAHRGDLAQACRERVETLVVDLQISREDCEPDAFAFCHDAGRGEPMVACLSARQGDLTPRCQAVFDGFARREAAAARACATEIARHCRDVKPGKGDVALCLLFRGKDLAPACRSALGR